MEIIKNKKNLHKKIFEDKVLLTLCLIFLLWKFFLISLLWNDRTSAPEPDDSYSYIARIESLKECLPLSCGYSDLSSTKSASLAYPSYRIFLGTISKYLNISAEKTYQLGFYIGTILLLPVLVSFLRRINTNKKALYLSIAFLTIYHGTPQTHGFYWVVPSFFSVLLLFIILTLILEKNYKNWLALCLIVTPILTLTHITSYYYIFILPIFWTIKTIFEKKIDSLMLKKIIFIFAIATITIFLQNTYIKNNSLDSPYSIINITKSAKKTLTNNFTKNQGVHQENKPNKTKERIGNMNEVYFNWIFFHWILLIPFFAVLFALWKNKQIILLSLFFSTLIFFVFSSLLNAFGFRSAIILWPITFVLYAHGIIYLKKELLLILRSKPAFKKVLLFIFNSTILIVMCCAILYSLALNISMNYRRNLIIDKEIIPYINKEITSSEKVYTERVTNLILFSLSKNTQKKINNTPITDNPNYIITLNETIESTDPKHNSNKIKLERIIKKFNPKMSPFKTASYPKIPSSYKLIKTFGSIEIYSK